MTGTSPFVEGRARVGLTASARSEGLPRRAVADSWRHHQEPDHERERGGVAELHG
jgi:hypothetical protein